MVPEQNAPPDQFFCEQNTPEISSTWFCYSTAETPNQGLLIAAICAAAICVGVLTSETWTWGHYVVLTKTDPYLDVVNASEAETGVI